MKVLWIILGVLGGLCLLCGGGAFFLFNKGKAVYDEALAYGNSSATAIGSNWSFEEFEKRGPEIVKQNGQDKIHRLLDVYQEKLGTLQGSPNGHLEGFHANSNNGVSETTAEWKADATFQKGQGTMTISMVNRGSGWQMMEFNINSPALQGVSIE